MKIITFYLPQFHVIPENDEWWGEGFTDWQAVKNARPLYKGHVQPHIPLECRYYDLSVEESIEWQANLAKKYGIYGFGIYHYWFNSEMNLLCKPAEIIKNSKKIDIHYMFIWDNTSWVRTWSNVKNAHDWAGVLDNKVHYRKKENGVLAELKYGDQEDWEKHFQYLLPFFRDEKYIKYDDRPMFAFFQPQNDFATVQAICSYWNKRAKEYGFAGICFLSRSNVYNNNLEYTFDYQPFNISSVKDAIDRKILRKLQKIIKGPARYSYDLLWKKIIKRANENTEKEHFFAALVNYDDTPRRGRNGIVVSGSTPEKFKNYFKQLLKVSYDKEFLFITAWNEWGEGAYLEPDEKYGYGYLEALRHALTSTNEWETITDRNPLISVVLVNYNGWKDTAECIDSLSGNQYDNYKIIIVDNGSTDDSYERLLALEGEKIAVIKSEENIGFSGGCNIGMKFALENGADYVLLLNNDTIVDKKFLEKIAEAAVKNPDAITTGKILYADEPDIIWYAGGSYNAVTTRTSHDSMDKTEASEENTGSREVGFISGCCMLIPKEIAEKTGNLDERFFLYCEDLEYCRRAVRGGYRLVYYPAAIIYHKVSASTGKLSGASTYYMVRNKYYIADLYATHTVIAKIYLSLECMKRILNGEYKKKAFLNAVKDYKKNRMGKMP